MTEPTSEQRKAIQAYVHSSLSPLLESVLVKQLSMAALFMRDEVAQKKSALQRIAEMLEDGDGPDIEDLLTEGKPRLSADERAQLAVVVRWARLPRE